MFEQTSYRTQFTYLLFQVFLVGMAAGSVRTVLPVIAESEYNLTHNSLGVISSIVIAFGLLKAISNVVAGLSSDVIGRKRVLVTGWILAIPVPVIFIYSNTWTGVVISLVFLGINQGLTWSMTQSAKIDIVNHKRRGHAMGLNEFAGYIGVALAGILTGVLAEFLDPRSALSLFVAVIVVVGLSSAQLSIKETKDYGKLKKAANSDFETIKDDEIGKADLSSFHILKLVSWQDKRMMAICQAGLIEKFVDALIWVYYPIYFYQMGLNFIEIGWVVGIYGIVWGAMQLFTGMLSDRIGRIFPIVIGMLLCALGVILTLLNQGFLWWVFCAIVTGTGMALLYPNLSAAIADLSPVENRGSALGIYRFWRDLGYGVAGLIFGFLAYMSGNMTSSFIFVSSAMTISALIVVVFCQFSSVMTSLDHSEFR